MSTQHPSCLARARCDDGRVFRFALRFPHLFTARLDPLAAHAGSNGPILAVCRLKRARSAASRRAIPGTRRWALDAGNQPKQRRLSGAQSRGCTLLL